ncbi:MAG TPA: SpoIIE family protein phosphatase [Pseudonocardia sp.]|nr:SpoIIE family protein phosphatase [Pseudonocardia sp.]
MSYPNADAPALILVVDDTPASRYIASSWLRRHGHQVIEASTGAEALAALARWPVDLVVLDVGLPDMSGLEVCERIKNDPALGHPVVHLSATAIRGADRARGLAGGADAYLVEPVEPDELVATVASVLRYYRARDSAEKFAGRLSRLTTATLAMHGATTFDQLTAAIATGAGEVIGAPAVALIAAPSGSLRRATASGAAHRAPALDTAPPALLGQLEALTATSVGRNRAVRVPWSLLAPGVDADAGDCAVFLFRSRSARPPVCLAVRLPELEVAQNDMLTQLGNAAVLAVDALGLYAEEHSLALTLQRSFLPSRPPERPGLEVAVRYVPAADNAEIGGDFYELVELPAGRLLIAIGDVAGHSIHAATVMVELRHALRAYAIEDHGPAEILARLEQILVHYHPTEFATLCLLLLDRDQNQLSIANAGHLSPLLIEAGESRYLDVRGPMLGLRRPHPPDTVRAMAPNWTIVLVTDGLVEHPGTDLDAALEELRLAASVDSAPEELSDQLLERFGLARLDDIALLVLRRTG